MSERIPLKGGDEHDEHDALTGWRKLIKFRPGERKKAKRSYIKRLRKWLKKEPHNE
jgi:hypothetical protein